MTPARMLAGAHLVGHTKMALFLNSNGKEIPNDGNGVPIDVRMKQFEYDYDVSEITGIPHRDYIEENRLRKELLKKFPTKYSGNNAIEKMSNEEYKRNEKDIDKELQTRSEMINEYNRKIKQLREQKTGESPKAYTAPLSYTNNPTTNNPSKHMNFNGISFNGTPWSKLSESSQRGFLEGFLGKSLAEVDNEISNKNKKKGHWTDKFNIGNPDTDNGHWVTLDNGKHIFIKDT